jgi:hypothetical protein
LEKAKRTVPLAIAIALLLSGIGMGAIAAYAVSMSINLPYNVMITFSPASLKIDALSMAGYDSANNIYTQMQVTVHNYASSGSATGTVTVYLYNSANSQIATGSLSTGSVSAATSVTIIVSLAWVSGNNVDNLASGRASLVVS